MDDSHVTDIAQSLALLRAINSVVKLESSVAKLSLTVEIGQPVKLTVEYAPAFRDGALDKSEARYIVESNLTPAEVVVHNDPA